MAGAGAFDVGHSWIDYIAQRSTGLINRTVQDVYIVVRAIQMSERLGAVTEDLEVLQ